MKTLKNKTATKQKNGQTPVCPLMISNGNLGFADFCNKHSQAKNQYPRQATSFGY